MKERKKKEKEKMKRQTRPSPREDEESTESPLLPPLKHTRITCSNSGHSSTPAKVYCLVCSLFFCEECETHHTFMFPSHASSVCTDLESFREVQGGKCGCHPDYMLDYLCRTHDVLCCAKCKLNQDGLHTKCNVVPIDKDTCSGGTKISGLLQDRIYEIKIDKLERLKKKQNLLEERVTNTREIISNTFKEIRGILNERERKMLAELDRAFESWNNSDLIVQIEEFSEAEKALENLIKIPKNKTMSEVEIRNSTGYACDARRAIKELDKLEKKLDAALGLESVIKFERDEEALKRLKNFGYVPQKEEIVLSWKEAPENIGSERRYLIDKSNPRIVLKECESWNYCTVIGKRSLPSDALASWGIKILRSKKNDGSCIYVGVAPFDINQNEDSYDKCGWYLGCYGSLLYSGPPHNYFGKAYGPRKGNGQYVHKGDNVGVVMDTRKGELSFSLNGVNLGVAFRKIPLDKPLVPSVSFLYKGDSVEIIPYSHNSISEPRNTSNCLIQ